MKVTNAQIFNFTVNDSVVSNTTTTGIGMLNLLANNNQLFSFLNPDGVFNFTTTINVSALDNLTINVSGFYDARVNISAFNFSFNSSNVLPIFNLSGNVSSSSNNFSESFNFSVGSSFINLTIGVNYSFFATAPNYTRTHFTNTKFQNITTDLELVNFTLFRDKSLFLQIRDSETNVFISGVTVRLLGVTNFNFTVDNQSFLFPFPVGSYDLLLSRSGFSSFSTNITINAFSLVNLTAFMSNETSDVSFIVRDLAGSFIENANVKIIRSTDNAVIANGFTDIFGAVQFPLNPDISYNINVTRSGFLPFFGTLNAFQSSYTITLSTAEQNRQFFIGLKFYSFY